MTTHRTLLNDCSPQIEELALATADLVMRLRPDAHQQVETSWGGYLLFKQPVDGGNTVCWVSAHARHVSLGFAEGVKLLAADPSGLLMGSGKRQRHVKLTKLEQLEQPELTDLIMAAWERQPRPEILVHGVDRLRALCFALPQVVEVESHGHPTFKVGKKSFAVYGIYAPSLAFRADLSMHGRLAEDERFYPTPYMAKQG